MSPHVNKVLVNFHRKQKILFAFVDNLRLRTTLVKEIAKETFFQVKGKVCGLVLLHHAHPAGNWHFKWRFMLSLYKAINHSILSLCCSSCLKCRSILCLKEVHPFESSA